MGGAGQIRTAIGSAQHMDHPAVTSDALTNHIADDSTLPYQAHVQCVLYLCTVGSGIRIGIAIASLTWPEAKEAVEVV